jgi:Flp pilus assembly protein TadD
MTPTARFAGCGVLLVAIIAIAYLPAFPGCFIWDDDSQLLENPLIHEPNGLSDIWLSARPLEYYPIYYTSLRFLWRLFGPHPAGYLVTNLVLHSLNAILLMILLRRLPWPTPLLGAIFFALHPVNVFAVAWINEHKTVLSTLFYLASALFYDSAQRRPAGRRGAWPGAAFVFFCAGLLTKPALIFLPVVFALAGNLLYQRRGHTLWAPLAPFFLVALAAGILRILWHPPVEDAFSAPRIEGLGAHLIFPGKAIFFYLAKLFWPARLMMVYPKWPISAAHPTAYLWSALVLAGGLWLWKRRRIQPVVVLGCFFFLLGLLPVLGFFDNQYFDFSYVANHWLYMPMMGVSALAAGGLVRLSRAGPSVWIRASKHVFPALISVLLLLRARTEAARFRDPVEYYQRGVLENPDNVIAHHNLANLYFDEGKSEQALPHYLEAIRIQPIFWKARNEAAKIFIRQGDIPRAIEQLTGSLQTFPQNPEAHFHLGTLYGQQGELTLAMKHLEAAVTINPRDPVAFNNLGITYYQMGLGDLAESCFRTALELNPAYEAARRNLERTAPGENGR